MAALVTRNDRHIIFPAAGKVSAEFGRELKAASCKNDRFNVVSRRAVELFGYRNDIAHGRMLRDEIVATNLLDLEVLVRNSILSFVDGGWDTLEQFKDWMNQRYETPSGCRTILKRAWARFWQWMTSFPYYSR